MRADKSPFWLFILAFLILSSVISFFVAILFHGGVAAAGKWVFGISMSSVFVILTGPWFWYELGDFFSPKS